MKQYKNVPYSLQMSPFVHLTFGELSDEQLIVLMRAAQELCGTQPANVRWSESTVGHRPGNVWAFELEAVPLEFVEELAKQYAIWHNARLDDYREAEASNEL